MRGSRFGRACFRCEADRRSESEGEPRDAHDDAWCPVPDMRVVAQCGHRAHRLSVTVMLRRAHEPRRTGLISRAYRDGILVMRELGPEPSGRRCLQLGGKPDLR